MEEGFERGEKKANKNRPLSIFGSNAQQLPS